MHSPLKQIDELSTVFSDEDQCVYLCRHYNNRRLLYSSLCWSFAGDNTNCHWLNCDRMALSKSKCIERNTILKLLSERAMTASEHSIALVRDYSVTNEFRR